MAERTIWVAGDWQHADFAAALAWLTERTRLLPLPLGEGRGEGGAPPHAILIAQSRPGQIARSAVEQWHARAPLARLIALLGPWCEGEQRSGKPWPGIVRVPWSTWPTRLPLALALDSPAIRLPRTATDAERLQSELTRLPSRQTLGTALVRTSSRVSFDGLRLALKACGLSAEWAGESTSAQADLEIIDGWEARPAAAGPPRILLLHFPRPDDLGRAAKFGVVAVVAQPLLIADLAQLLQRLRSHSQSLAALPEVA